MTKKLSKFSAHWHQSTNSERMQLQELLLSCNFQNLQASAHLLEAWILLWMEFPIQPLGNLMVLLLILEKVKWSIEALPSFLLWLLAKVSQWDSIHRIEQELNQLKLSICLFYLQVMLVCYQENKAWVSKLRSQHQALHKYNLLSKENR